MLPKTANSHHREPQTIRSKLPLRYLFIAFVLAISLVLTFGFLLIVVDSGSSATRIEFPTSVHQLRDSAGAVRALVKRQPILSSLLLTVAYLTKQSFAIPGSALLNAIIGVAYGLPVGLCIATVLCGAGASCGYLLSAEFGGGLLHRFGLEERIWPLRMQVEAARKRGTLFLTLLSMRVFPGTPHWALNYAAPHAGVPVPIFAVSAALGMSGYNALCIYAGDRVATTTWSEVFTWGTLGSFALVAALLALPALLPKQMHKCFRFCKVVLFLMGGADGKSKGHSKTGAAVRVSGEGLLHADTPEQRQADVGMPGDFAAAAEEGAIREGSIASMTVLSSGDDGKSGQPPKGAIDQLQQSGNERHGSKTSILYSIDEKHKYVDSNRTALGRDSTRHSMDREQCRPSGSNSGRDSWISWLFGVEKSKNELEPSSSFQDGRGGSGTADYAKSDEKKSAAGAFRQHAAVTATPAPASISEEDTSGDQAAIAMNAWPLRRHL